MLEGLELTSPNILLSGGAEGADTVFGKVAIQKDHQVVHWTFDGHKSKLRKNLYKLSGTHLKEADNVLTRANKGLIRSFPTKSEYGNNLLRRNLYQVKWSESVYAVTRFTNDSSMLKVGGGTAWACQIYVDRFLYDQEPISMCHMYVYDMISDGWYKWEKTWKAISSPPCPSGIYAGIGSRDLTEKGISAITDLYNQ